MILCLDFNPILNAALAKSSRMQRSAVFGKCESRNRTPIFQWKPALCRDCPDLLTAFQNPPGQNPLSTAPAPAAPAPAYPLRPPWTRSGNIMQNFDKQIIPTNQTRETRYWGARFIPPSKITEIAIAWPARLIVSFFAQWGLRLSRRDI